MDWCPNAIRPRGAARREAANADQAPGRAVRAPDLARDVQADEDLNADDEVLGEEEEEEDAPQPVRPTANLLGWHKPTSLRPNQLSELSDVLPEPERPFMRIARYSVHRELFEFVERKLRECKRYKLSQIPCTTAGSVAQQVTWSPSEWTPNRFDHFTSQPGQCTSRTTLPLRVANAAKVMCYRAIRREFIRDDDQPVSPCSCFCCMKQLTKMLMERSLRD